MTACASLLCDACSNPGRCCAGFHLPIAEDAGTVLEALVAAATVRVGTTRGGRSVKLGEDGDGSGHLASAEVGLPFLPLWRTPGGLWRWWCPNLVGGRCAIYEDRPTLCRRYAAGSDGLCCMSAPASRPEHVRPVPAPS